MCLVNTRKVEGETLLGGLTEICLFWLQTGKTWSNTCASTCAYMCTYTYVK